MSDPLSAEWIKGSRVCVLVWNGFTHDARVLRESRSLAREGARVKVVCLRVSHDQQRLGYTKEGIEIERIAKKSWLSKTFGKVSTAMANLVEEFVGSLAMAIAVVRSNPDVIHGNDVNTLIPAWLGAKICRARLIYDAHEISADREGYRGRVALVKFLERHLGGDADAWMSTTRMRTRWFEEHYGYQVGHVVQNRPSVSHHAGNTIRERFKIPDSEIVFLYQGGLQSGRGLRNLIQSSAGTSGLRLVILGDGAMKDELVGMAKAFDAPVLFAGQVALEDLPLWTASADVGMQILRNTCLNHYSTDSNKLFEYAMGGLAVIASDFPEIRAVIENHGFGRLVDPEDVGCIRMEMQKLVDDQELLESLKSKAVRSRELLDWYSQEPAFFSAYRQALSNGSPEGLSDCESSS